MIDLLIVRHGVRSSAKHEAAARLTEHGRHQVSQLGKALDRRAVRPGLYLSSARTPALETAHELQRELDPSAPIVEVDALTPDQLPAGIDALVNQAAKRGHDLAMFGTVAIVGHEGRVSD